KQRRSPTSIAGEVHCRGGNSGRIGRKFVRRRVVAHPAHADLGSDYKLPRGLPTPLSPPMFEANDQSASSPPPCEFATELGFRLGTEQLKRIRSPLNMASYFD